ncbi:FAD dependent oxidoreductase [Colletotrichum tofieldiae]|nr:FAD dependent oxidoreductase [Colletotrichum tofieldiae]
MPAIKKKKAKTKTKKQRREKSQQLAAARILQEASTPPPLPAMDPQAKRNIVIVGTSPRRAVARLEAAAPKLMPEGASQVAPQVQPRPAPDNDPRGHVGRVRGLGKAGGLLALWAYPQCLVPLSYRLHRELAAEHGGEKRWGYRRVNCGSFEARVTRQMLDRPKQAAAKPEAVAPGANNGEQEKGWERLPKQDEAAESMLEESALPRDLDWVDRDAVESYAEMGTPGATETAQVHPYHFTTSMAALAQDKGVEVRTRAQLKTIASSSEGVRSVEYLDRDSGETRTIDDVTDVLVSAGPWTGRLLPGSKVTGLRAHSVVYNADVSPYAVFTSIKLPADFVPEHRASKGQKRKHKRVVDPEIYARPDGEVYACGEPDENAPLPDTADKVQVDEANCDDIISYIATVSPALAAAPIKAKQACYLPQHESGPLIGATSVPGLWLAAGHTCWGIQNGPATGKLMSEYILDGKPTSSDISSLDPRRFKV